MREKREKTREKERDAGLRCLANKIRRPGLDLPPRRVARHRSRQLLGAQSSRGPFEGNILSGKLWEVGGAGGGGGVWEGGNGEEENGKEGMGRYGKEGMGGEGNKGKLMEGRGRELMGGREWEGKGKEIYKEEKKMAQARRQHAHAPPSRASPGAAALMRQAHSRGISAVGRSWRPFRPGNCKILQNLLFAMVILAMRNARGRARGLQTERH